MEPFFLIIIFPLVILLLLFFDGRKLNSYKTACPNCTKQTLVRIYRASDKAELINCSCGHHEFEVI